MICIFGRSIWRTRYMWSMPTGILEPVLGMKSSTLKEQGRLFVTWKKCDQEVYLHPVNIYQSRGFWTWPGGMKNHLLLSTLNFLKRSFLYYNLFLLLYSFCIYSFSSLSLLWLFSFISSSSFFSFFLLISLCSFSISFIFPILLFI